MYILINIYICRYIYIYVFLYVRAARVDIPWKPSPLEAGLSRTRSSQLHRSLPPRVPIDHCRDYTQRDLQGYLAHKKLQPLRNLQLECA